MPWIQAGEQVQQQGPHQPEQPQPKHQVWLTYKGVQFLDMVGSNPFSALIPLNPLLGAVSRRFCFESPGPIFGREKGPSGPIIGPVASNFWTHVFFLSRARSFAMRRRSLAFSRSSFTP